MDYRVSAPANNSRPYRLYIILSLVLVLAGAIAFGGYKIVFFAAEAEPVKNVSAGAQAKDTVETKPAPIIASPEEYDRRLAIMVNGDSSGRWPVRTEYPLEGAILPYKRVVAYYGNLYSKQMGILGELPRTQMLKK